MLERITADFDALETFESSLSRMCEEIAGLLNELRSQVAMLNESWEGAASEGFQATVQQWSTAADDLPQRLSDLQRMVSRTRGNYQSALAANLRTWGGRG